MYGYSRLPASRGHWRLVNWMIKMEPSDLAKLQVTRGGLTWECDLSCGYYDRDIFYRGVYEPDSIALVMSEIQPGDVVIDVGANIGYYSLMMGKRVGATGRVYSFEPSSQFYKRLKKGIDTNGLSAIIIPVKVGLSDCVGEAMLHVGETTASISMEGPQFDQSNETIVVDTMDCCWLKMGDSRRVSLIKVDVDGFEVRVLRGSKRLLEKYHPKMLIEVCPYVLKQSGSSWSEMLAILEEYGYNQFAIAGDGKMLTARGVSEKIAHLDSTRFDFVNLLCVERKG